MGRGTGFPIETWEGYDIRVDAKGTFFVDAEGARAMAPSLEALKAKLRKPVVVDGQGVIFMRWSDNEYERVRVYGISPLGNILYEDSHKRKRRADPYDAVYRWDPVRVRRRVAETLRPKEAQA